MNFSEVVNKVNNNYMLKLIHVTKIWGYFLAVNQPAKNTILHTNEGHKLSQKSTFKSFAHTNIHETLLI